jgi:hypothetical protein
MHDGMMMDGWMDGWMELSDESSVGRSIIVIVECEGVFRCKRI